MKSSAPGLFRCTTALVVLGLLSFSFSLSVHPRTKTASTKRRLALVGGTIYPAPFQSPISNGVVLIENGKISKVGQKEKLQIPPDADTIDCTGRTIVAGFWNSHVHFTEPKWENAANLPATQLTKQLQEMLTRYGFTSVVDTGSLLTNTVAIRARIESGAGEVRSDVADRVAGPRILTAGSPLFPKDGIPYYVLENLPPDLVKTLDQPATPEEAVRAVDEHVANGADIIKLFAVSPIHRDGKLVFLPMSLDIVQAATAEAHRKGKLVFAHPSLVEGAELVIRGHVDVLAHTVEDPEHWDNSLVQRLKAANVSLIPTLTLFSGENGPDAAHEGISREVKSYSDAGGQILFGTDIGYLTDYPLLTREFELLHRAGLSFDQILAALTTTPAARFGFAATTGRVAAGQNADLVVLNGDPAHDIKAFSRVALTIRSGNIIYSAAH
ncbi:MAG TPA: amidohydrolase family protein [Candidatus Acidoferrum sp.]|jgi:imidazolonepropionase-like amidohydrolase